MREKAPMTTRQVPSSQSSYDVLDERYQIEKICDRKSIRIRGNCCRTVLSGIWRFLRNSVIGCERGYVGTPIKFLY